MKFLKRHVMIHDADKHSMHPVSLRFENYLNSYINYCIAEALKNLYEECVVLVSAIEKTGKSRYW